VPQDSKLQKLKKPKYSKINEIGFTSIAKFCVYLPGLLTACKQDQDGAGLVPLLVGFHSDPACKLSADLYGI
jgi:hypothetical protein